MEAILKTITGDASTFKTRVAGKVLLTENQSVGHAAKVEARLVKKRQRMSKKFINRKEKKLIQTYSKAELLYTNFLPLNSLWLQYMTELLGGEKNISQTMPRLVRSDYHGCIFNVCDAAAKSSIGISGIVIKETMHTFHLLTPANILKTILKKQTNFSFEFDDIIYTLYGNQLISRSGDRQTKKFKGAPTIAFT